MATNEINPVKIIDATLADTLQAAYEANEMVEKELRGQLSRMHKDTPHRRQISTRIDACVARKAEIRAKQEENSFVDPVEAVWAILEACADEHGAQSMDAVLAGFAERFASNPLDAMSWRADDVVVAVTKNGLRQSLVQTLSVLRNEGDGMAFLEAVVVKLEEWRESQLERLLGSVGYSQSNPFDVAIKDYQTRATAEFLRDTLSWPRMRAEHLLGLARKSAPRYRLYVAVEKIAAQAQGNGIETAL